MINPAAPTEQEPNNPTAPSSPKGDHPEATREISGPDLSPSATNTSHLASTSPNVSGPSSTGPADPARTKVRNASAETESAEDIID